MFEMSVIRILLALSLIVVLCSSQKAFLKGLLIGSLLGKHGKKALYEKGDESSKEYHHYDAPEKDYLPVPVHKEYIPVPIHQEPQYVPVYIVKECSKKHLYTSHQPLHHHHHQHNHVYDAAPEVSYDDYGSGVKDKYLDSAYNGNLESHESRVNAKVRNGFDENDIRINISAHKD